MAEKKGSYAGAIPNTGSANVKAPFPAPSAKKGTVHKGNDLRNGKGK